MTTSHTSASKAFKPELIESYRSGRYRLTAHALMRAVDPSSKMVLVKYTPVSIQSTILVSLANDKECVDDVAYSELLLEFSKIVKGLMKSNTTLKNKIGRIKWKVDIIDKVVKVYKHEILK